MISNQIITFNSDEDKIRQLHREISSYITTLDKNIRDGKDSYLVPQYKINRWKDKKAVLEIALLCLSGEKNLSDLNSAINDPDHSHWNDKDGWWECETEVFVKKVITLLTQHHLAPSFVWSCVENIFNLMPDDI